MRVALGTIEVNDYQRRALAHHYGSSGLASREEVRQFVRSNGELALIEDVTKDYEFELEWEEETRRLQDESAT